MVRPTTSVSSLITSDNQTLTPPSNTRGLMVVAFREGTHLMSGVTFGGVSLLAGHEITNPETFGPSDLHLCTFYIDDYSDLQGRANNVLDFSGGTLGGTTDDDLYRAVVFWIIHSTHEVTMAAQVEDIPENVQTQSISVSVNPGAGVEALGIVVATTGGFNYIGPLHSGTDMLGPSIIDTDGNDAYIYGSRANITGATSMGMTSGAGQNPHAAMIAEAWIQGSVLAAPPVDFEDPFYPVEPPIPTC